MKKNVFLQIAAVVIVATGAMLVPGADRSAGQNPRPGKFEEYRTAIKNAYQIDIASFKEKLTGGKADGKAITRYDLRELLEGIKFEMEHGADRFLALELTMDHLERIPDYYERLSRLEREAIAAPGQPGRKVEGNFERYRKSIQDAFRIDIKNFKERLRGGKADGKPITRYDLAELLEGIKWERQHTRDNFIALELAMDHLEEIPDYYSRVLCRLERECASDQFLRQ